ncbi:2,4-dichlorophenol 6-monooxygenase [Pseudocercospora fuligena]|uniref:2,4-dichlorophenol 6-monooxygenase n=1 Tax=Pseudocercospora fuligena TaxID=685502 RepID=A0A8H6VS51_9PEZI|nr:2,4-dichlorophenol 6-monooxygenase [Pseudocercospora fuligena]
MSLPGSIGTDLLIIGAGPAGASLAAFLSRYGLKGMMISAGPGTADTPRAHITNLSALDAFRDIDLADECYRLGHQGEHTRHYRWCETLAGEEYARLWSWGNDPKRKGDYERASPNPGILDLPQTVLEPMLVRFATNHGWRVQFNQELISFHERVDADGKHVIVALVKDRLRDVEYHITCRYLFGADGGRSVVASQLGLPFNKTPGEGTAWNVLVKSDIGHLMQSREGNLHWNLRLQRNDPWMVNTRMVKPWNEWLMAVLPKDPFTPAPEYSAEEWKDVWRDLVGDPDIEVEVLKISKWAVNEVCAEKYSNGRVLCLGDAVHRHPPTNGLGSNTCVGDAFNLAWKINLVMKGVADESLLETYSIERQPVAAEVVKITNVHLRHHVAVWQILGVMPPGPDWTLEKATAGLKIMEEDSEAGRQARTMFRDTFLSVEHETHALGLEMGQRYVSNAVVKHEGESEWQLEGKEKEDPILFYESSTYPGRRLPHMWLSTRSADKKISTHDLAGKGKFSLMTGIGGGRWKEAAKIIEQELELPINCFSIGLGQDWEDLYFDWSLKRGIEEDGAVLVRPDLFVAWRAPSCPTTLEEAKRELEKVFRTILGRP